MVSFVLKMNLFKHQEEWFIYVSYRINKLGNMIKYVIKTKLLIFFFVYFQVYYSQYVYSNWMAA